MTIDCLNGKLDIGDYSLEEIQNELCSIMSDIKPEDKLKVNDCVEIEKDVTVLGYGKIGKGTKIKIVEINKAENSSLTTKISYQIGDNEDILTMSKGVFVTSFCDKIKTEQKHIDDRLKKLRNKERKFKEEFKRKNINSSTEEVKEKFNFIVELTKSIKKKLGHKNGKK